MKLNLNEKWNTIMPIWIKDVLIPSVLAVVYVAILVYAIVAANSGYWPF